MKIEFYNIRLDDEKVESKAPSNDVDGDKLHILGKTPIDIDLDSDLRKSFMFGFLLGGYEMYRQALDLHDALESPDNNHKEFDKEIVHTVGAVCHYLKGVIDGVCEGAEQGDRFYLQSQRALGTAWAALQDVDKCDFSIFDEPEDE